MPRRRLDAGGDVDAAGRARYGWPRPRWTASSPPASHRGRFAAPMRPRSERPVEGRPPPPNPSTCASSSTAEACAGHARAEGCGPPGPPATAARPTSRYVGRVLVAVQLDRAQAHRGARRLGTSAGGASHEDADPQHAGREGGGDGLGPLASVTRRLLPAQKLNPSDVHARLDARRGVLEPGDAADLDARPHRQASTSARTAAAGVRGAHQRLADESRRRRRRGQPPDVLRRTGCRSRPPGAVPGARAPGRDAGSARGPPPGVSRSRAFTPTSVAPRRPAAASSNGWTTSSSTSRPSPSRAWAPARRASAARPPPAMSSTASAPRVHAPRRACRVDDEVLAEERDVDRARTARQVLQSAAEAPALGEHAHAAGAAAT